MGDLASVDSGGSGDNDSLSSKSSPNKYSGHQAPQVDIYLCFSVFISPSIFVVSSLAALHVHRILALENNIEPMI